MAKLFDRQRTRASRICDQSGKAKIDREGFWMDQVGGRILADQITRAAPSALGVLSGCSGLQHDSLGEVAAESGLIPKADP